MCIGKSVSTAISDNVMYTPGIRTPALKIDVVLRLLMESSDRRFRHLSVLLLARV